MSTNRNTETNSNYLIGRNVEDVITGFKGVVTGVVYYLTGCSQALVSGRVSADGKRPEAEWFDVQRLKPTDETVLILDNGKTPGCDALPSRRY